jgi:DNA-binding winged helix-turn-helix (wHTH) protein/tetratricopeptide (TPR) repeat protein
MEQPKVYRWGSFRIDCGERVVAHRGERVALRGKPFELLALLSSRAGRVVDKSEIMGTLWPGITVHENNIAVTVRSLRQALRRHEPELELIETVPGRGYRVASPALARSPLGVGERDRGGPVTARELAPERSCSAPLPFVARDAELARLDQHWTAARRGAGRVVFISGEPGIGKSALLERFIEQARARAPLALVLRGQCLQLFGLIEPHLPIRAALVDGLGGPSRDELLEALELHAPSWCARLPPALVGTGPRQPAHGAQAGMHELVEALRATALNQPVLLALEDLHWADASSIDLLRALAFAISERAVLVVGTLRPLELVGETRSPRRVCPDVEEVPNAERPIWPGSPCPSPAQRGRGEPGTDLGHEALGPERHPLAVLLDDLAVRGQREQLALAPWQLHELERYLALCFGSGSGAAVLARVIERRSEGLPLFAVRWIESLVERGLVRPAGAGAWTSCVPVNALTPDTPASVAALIRSQIEGLAPRSRRLLEIACVDGAEFGTALLASVLAAAAADVEDSLERAVAQGLIERSGEQELRAGLLDVRYRFRHVLYRDHLYDQLGSHRRKDLHRAIAHALLDERAALAPSAGRLALHFERARDPSRAVAYWTEAGDEADRAFAKLEALECYRRAAALLDSLPPGERAVRRLVLEHGRGWASFGLGRAGAMRQHFLEFARLARELESSPPEEREPALTLAQEYFERPWSDALMQRPASIFPKGVSSDVCRELLAEALHCCCQAASADGRVSELEDHARALEQVAAASRSSPRRAEALAWLGAHALLAGRAQAARRWLDEALVLARSLGHERALRLALGDRAWLHLMQSELERAQLAYEELASITPAAATAAGALSQLGDTLARRGQPRAALEIYARADLLRRRIEPGAPSLHGWLWRELGQPGRARELDARAVARLRERSEPALLARLLSSLATSACREGDENGAREALRDAAPLLTGAQQSCSWRMGSLWSAQCELAASVGDMAELLAIARRWLRSARARDDADGLKQASRWLAIGEARAGDVQQAKHQLSTAIEVAKTHPSPLVDWRVHALLAQLASRTGDIETEVQARMNARRLIAGVARAIEGADERRCFEGWGERELAASAPGELALP